MDEVKKALEKVVSARVRGRRPDETLWDDTMQDVSSLIAVFLRAFPPVGELQRFDEGSGTFNRLRCSDLHELAAAVERAACEGRAPDAG